MGVNRKLVFESADSRGVCLRKTCLLSAKIGEGSYGMGWRKGATYALLLVTVLFVYVRSGGGEMCQDTGMKRYGDVESTVEMIRL